MNFKDEPVVQCGDPVVKIKDGDVQILTYLRTQNFDRNN